MILHRFFFFSVSCKAPIHDIVDPNINLAVEPSSGIASWPENINDTFREQCIQYGPQYFQNRLGMYPESKQVLKTQNRFLSDALFTRKLKKRGFCGKNLADVFTIHRKSILLPL